MNQSVKLSVVANGQSGFVDVACEPVDGSSVEILSFSPDEADELARLIANAAGIVRGDRSQFDA